MIQLCSEKSKFMPTCVMYICQTSFTKAVVSVANPTLVLMRARRTVSSSLLVAMGIRTNRLNTLMARK